MDRIPLFQPYGAGDTAGWAGLTHPQGSGGKGMNNSVGGIACRTGISALAASPQHLARRIPAVDVGCAE